MLLLYPGELYRLLGASSFVFSFHIFIHFMSHYGNIIQRILILKPKHKMLIDTLIQDLKLIFFVILFLYFLILVDFEKSEM